MIMKHIIQGGLWEEDALALKTNPHLKNLKISYEIDGYHLQAEYDEVIYCPSCGGTMITKTLNEHYCDEYECSCSCRWVDNFDFHLWLEGGDEFMKQLRGVEDGE